MADQQRRRPIVARQKRFGGVGNASVERCEFFTPGKTSAGLVGGLEAVDEFGLDAFGREVGKMAGFDLAQRTDFLNRHVAPAERRLERLSGAQQAGVTGQVEGNIGQRLAHQGRLAAAFFGEFHRIGIGHAFAGEFVVDLAVAHQIDAAAALGAGQAERHRINPAGTACT